VLKADRDWFRRYMNGDGDAAAEQFSRITMSE
jgi:hypothetical protein